MNPAVRSGFSQNCNQAHGVCVWLGLGGGGGGWQGGGNVVRNKKGAISIFWAYWNARIVKNRFLCLESNTGISSILIFLFSPIPHFAEQALDYEL